MSEWKEDDEAHWRKTHGAEIRKMKGRESEPDPDWSLPEISREGAALAKEFWDWLYSHVGAIEPHELQHMIDAWMATRFKTSLSSAAAGLLLFRIRERMKEHVEEPVLPPEPEPDEDRLAYIQRTTGLDCVTELLAAPEPPDVITITTETYLPEPMRTEVVEGIAAENAQPPDEPFVATDDDVDWLENTAILDTPEED